MTGQSQTEKAQSVQLVEADVFDRMNETRALIAQRAYEIYESRGGGHGSDQDDWFNAEGQLLPKIEIEYHVSDSDVCFTGRVPGFEPNDLEVAVGHLRAAICGIHSGPSPATVSGRKIKKVMRIVELPFAVDPALGTATLQSEILQVMLPRSK